LPTPSAATFNAAALRFLALQEVVWVETGLE
jgi:hypothetical protein